MLGVGTLELAVACLSVFLVIRHSQRESLAAFDGNLASRATSLLALIDAPENSDSPIVLRKEFLPLPPTDRYTLTTLNHQLIAETPNWAASDQIPQGTRRSFDLSSNGISYRALFIPDSVIVDPDDKNRRESPPHVALIYAAETTQMDAHLRQVATITTLACLFMLGLSLALTFWIVRSGLKPLDALAFEASSINEGKWDFKVPASATEVNELKPLSAALSHSVERLKAAFERERQMFGDAAHELKTAVAIIKSTLQLAVQTKRPAEEYRERLNRALANTDRLEQLITRILQLISIESARANRESETEVTSVIEYALDRFSPVAQARGVQIRLHSAEAHCVNIPEQDFLLLAGNLIENAIQHSPSGQSIEVSLMRKNGTSELKVRDHGSGIPSEALPRVFERFFRADQSRSRASGGFGLGLAIVQALAVKYHGVLAVESVVDQGTTFTAQFPIFPRSIS